jgi:hypothetical protein
LVPELDFKCVLHKLSSLTRLKSSQVYSHFVANAT